MKEKEPVCFISYCHADVDRDLIEYLIYVIRSAMKDKVKVLYDSDLRPAENLKKFMDRTLDVDAALMLMTPAYRQKVDRREGGVYTEYTKISNRFWESESRTNRNAPPDFTLVPVVVSGSFADSVPETLRDLICVNLVGFSVVRDKNNQFVVSDFIKERFARQVQRITDALVATKQLKSDTFAANRHDLYNTLIVNTKATDLILRQCPEFYTEVFVPTASFENVWAQKSFFLIGRKGSGKSTLATALREKGKESYNAAIQIRADDINLKAAYGMLGSSIKADIDTVLPSLSFFNYSWQGFLCLCLIEVVDQLSADDRITPVQKSFAAPLAAFLTTFKRGHTHPEMKGAFFTFATERLQEYFELCLKQARANDGTGRFLTDMRVAFNINDYLTHLLSREVINALSQIVSHCRKRVLVTLDDFDTIFDTFRQAAKTEEDARERSRFEEDWLRSLFLLIMDIKDVRFDDHTLFRTFDFCITVPKDRYLAIERSERDGYRYNARTSSIDWSGIELCDVLVRRLVHIYDGNERRGARVHEWLRDILRNTAPTLPDEISVEFNGKEIKLPLFCYVLRHTFWRPRDVLMYYADILAAASSVRQTGYPLTDNVIKRVISETTYRIIKTDFLDEYKSAMPNIREVVNGFMECPQVLSYEGLAQRIQSRVFALGEKPTDLGMTEKMEFLYDIGFLGVILSDEVAKALNLGSNEAFFFSEGRTPMRAARKREWKDVRFAIHPIFSENLQVTHRQNDFLLRFTWDYLYENHALKQAAIM